MLIHKQTEIIQIILSRGVAGAERHVAELATELAQICSVTLVIRHDCQGEDKTSIRDLVPDNLSILTLRKPFWTLRLQTFLARHRPAILHSHGGRAGRLTKRVKGARAHIATLHQSYSTKAHAHQHGLICVGAWQTNAISSDFTGMVKHIPNWTLPKPPPDPSQLARLRAQLGIAPTAMVIGAIGRLHPVKRHHALLEAWAMARPSEAHLVILGEGPERPKLEALAGERVHLPGFQHHTNIWYYMFDIFVSAALHEPFALSFLEALDAGCPVLSAPNQTAQELCQAGQPVSVTLSGDVSELAQALQHELALKRSRIITDMSHYRIKQARTDVEQFYADVLRNSIIS